MEAAARIAVVGVGRIGREHVAAIEQSPKLVLAGVVDANEQALAQAAAGDAVRATDVESLLRETPIDAAIVAVPTVYHVEVVSSLLKEGVPVLCEKPCGLSSAAVRELVALASEVGVPLHVGYWRRFVPELRELRERILGGDLGVIATLMAIQWDEEPPPPGFRDPRSSGGIMLDMGVHEFDMLRWLTGQELVEMSGLASETTWAEPVEDDPEAVGLVARLSGGPTALISLARRHPPGDVCRVEVLGGDAPVALTYVDPAKPDAAGVRPALQAQAEALAAAARGETTELADAADAEAAVVAAEAANAAVGLLVGSSAPAAG